MRSVYFSAFVFLFSSTSMALTESYTCTFNNETRTVDVNNAGAIPCNVSYTKNGVTTEPYNAQHDASFCLQKGKELTETLSNSGWSCTPSQTAKLDSADTATKDAETVKAQPTPATVNEVEDANVHDVHETTEEVPNTVTE